MLKNIFSKLFGSGKKLKVERDENDIDPSRLLMAFKVRNENIKREGSAKEAKERLKRIILQR